MDLTYVKSYAWQRDAKTWNISCNDWTRRQHLETMYKMSTSGRTPTESEIIDGVLTKLQYIFTTFWRLGSRTHTLDKTDHYYINTDDAPPPPGKQRSRLVPMAYTENERKGIDELPVHKN